MADRLLVTSRIWLKVSNLRWIGGVVDGVSEREVTITLENGEQHIVPRGSDRISQRTPQGMEAVDDLTNLPDLDEPNMLHSLYVRYAQKRIYTRTGPILVGINPWEDLNLYGTQTLMSYRKQKMDKLPPHVFAISENAFANLQSERKDQTILVSGDSGSGKTESTKFMMQYLAAVSHHTAVTASTEQQVLQCNPVLEAFGNAKTLRNDNSSRFGKYIDIHFDEKYALCGAKIYTYLLEKSRVVSQEVGERNFHIFYQLCSQAGVNAALTTNLDLKQPEHFRYIKQGAAIAVNYKSATSFNNTLEAFDACGIHGDERDHIFRVLSAVLHLGNIVIGSDGTGPNADARLSKDDPITISCARMLGCAPAALTTALVMRNIQVGATAASSAGTGGEVYTVSQTQQQAEDARDAMARVLYGALFDALVHRINKSLGSLAGVKLSGTISILDIFGFEHFKTNHFEQFCINYANEKLQGHFNEFNFSLEVKEYEREEIQWSYEDFYFQTNTKCIELIEAKRTGVLSLLDEQCIMPNGCDETFCLKLSQIVDHPHLQLARMSVTQFTVKHYAADVVYDVQGFCAKNKDPVQPALMELMSKGSSPYVMSLFSDVDRDRSAASSDTPVRGRITTLTRAQSTIIFESVTAKFKRQLADLMIRIHAAQPHFVRCINPNSQKVPRLLEPEMVLDQLRCSGLMEAVRVSRAGFPVRILHLDFVGRFSILCAPRPGDPPKEKVRSMMVALHAKPDSYRIGITKLFLRRDVHEKLEEDRSRLVVRHAVEVQRVCRGHLARNHVRFLRQLRLDSAIQLQRHVRKTLAYNWYQRNLQARLQAINQAKAAAAAAAQGQQGQHRPPELAPENNGHVANSVPSSPAVKAGDHQTRVSTPHAARPVSSNQAGLASEIYRAETANQMELRKVLWDARVLQTTADLDKQLKALDEAIAFQRSKLGPLTADKGDDQLSHWMHEMTQRQVELLEASKALVDEKRAAAAARPLATAGGTGGGEDPRQQVQRLEEQLRRRDAEVHQLGVWLAEARSKASNVDQVREELDEQYRAQLARRLRQYGDMGLELQAARDELRWREADVAQLNARLNQLRQIAAVALKMDIGGGYFNHELAARLLEQDIRGVDGLRGLVHADLTLYARDQRIAQLGRMLEEQRRRAAEVEREAALDLMRKTEAAQEELRRKDARIEELSVRLYMMTEMVMRLNDQQQQQGGAGVPPPAHAAVAQAGGYAPRPM